MLAADATWNSTHTLETNESSTSPCHVSEVVGATTKPKKKRVRRVKLELEFLRQESKKLEDELAQLLAIHAQRQPNASSMTPAMQNGYRSQQQKPSVWQGIALRQSNARGRSLAFNLELRARLEAEYNVGKQLVQLLHRQSNAKVQRQPVTTQDGTFRKLLERAEDSLLEIRKVLQGEVFRDPSTSFNDTFVEKEGGKEVFVMQSNMALPFCKEATMNALWKMLRSNRMDEYCYYRQVVHKTETMVGQVFGIKFMDGCMSADFQGRHIFSPFNDEDRTVIAWVAEIDLIELNGEKLSGVQVGTRGWMQVSEHESAAVKRTLVRSYSRLSVESSNQPDFSLRSFFNLAQRIHDRFLAAYSATMEKSIIEEDWKLNCGLL